MTLGRLTWHWPLGIAIVIIFSFCWPVFSGYGLQSDGSLVLYGAHYTDSINNIALIKSLKKSIPPENPNLSGTDFGNYHYFINLLLARTSFLTGVDDFVIYFRYAPIVLISLLTTGIYLLVYQITRSRFQAVLGSLLGLVSSNFYYLSSLLYSRSNPAPSVAWVDEFSTKLVNFQYLSSLIIIVYLLLFSARAKIVKPAVHLFLTGLASGTLIGFKVYGWIVFSLSQLLSKPYFFSGLTSLLAGLAIGSLVLTSNGQNMPFLFYPLWFIRTMYESPDRLNYPQWELARQTLISTSSYLGLAKLYLVGLSVFLLINFGPRLICLLGRSSQPVVSQLHKLSLASLFIPLFFIQSGAAWNTIQFAYYSVFFLSLLTAVRIKNPIVLSLIWLTLLPGVVTTSSTYAHPAYTARISSDIIAAASFLTGEPDGAVLTSPEFSGNAVVSAVSGHPAFLGDRNILSSYGIDYSSRQAQIESFLSGSGPVPSGIRYMFLKLPATPPPDFEAVYSNSQVAIFRLK